ncbi:hypothetical protein ABZZ20_30285 [Streptomyces sp. NPDC006430]|uniref:hypothetical protein n=1 Tax=Streptomyces sp. NPDC006430 TaxID=3154299 RepID=UPI0033AD342B
MTDTFLWIALICAVLGTGCAAWTSSGVGRMHYTDSRELRRQQHFRHVLSRHVEETQPPWEGAVAAVSEAAGIAACAECGASSAPLALPITRT